MFAVQSPHFEIHSRFERHEHIHPERDIVGESGIRIFELKTLERGPTKFQVAYARSWDYDRNFESFAGKKYEFNLDVV